MPIDTPTLRRWELKEFMEFYPRLYNLIQQVAFEDGTIQVNEKGFAMPWVHVGTMRALERRAEDIDNTPWAPSCTGCLLSAYPQVMMKSYFDQ